MKGLMILPASMGVVTDEESVNVMRELKQYHLEAWKGVKLMSAQCS